MKYFIALVIKSGLLNNANKDIPDILFVAAPDKDKAIEMVSKHQFQDAVWVKNKSVCRISKMLDVGSLNRNTLVLAEDDLHSYGSFVRAVGAVDGADVEAPPPSPTVSIRRRRRKKKAV